MKAKFVIIMALLFITVCVYAQVPDTLTFELDGQVVKIAAKDVKDLVATTTGVIKENEGSWPTTLAGWALLIFSFLVSARGAIFITQARKVGAIFIKLFGKATQPLNTLVLISGALSTGLTFLIGKGTFNPQFFVTSLGIIFGASVYIYERFLKPKKTKIGK